MQGLIDIAQMYGTLHKQHVGGDDFVYCFSNHGMHQGVDDAASDAPTLGDDMHDRMTENFGYVDLDFAAY